MKHCMLVLVAIFALPLLCNVPAYAQSDRLKGEKIKEIISAPSAIALKAEFIKSKFPFQLQTLKCNRKEFLWLTIDEGSGGYLIHAFLYEMHGESPRLVLHILPDAGRIAIVPEVQKQRVVILERRKQAPKVSGAIAQYFPE